MPEIKIKHIVSFSSEDAVYKAENLLKPETFRKWRCASPGEKNASIVLQFEKANQIQSIDVGNEHSAFVEILVGRSSDSTNDYQVLLTASSFMSPLESRNSTNTNRVRMFGAEKFAQNLKNEKWDCVQLICTQPFNKSVQYGLSFVKFHSVPDPAEESATKTKKQMKLGAFRLKEEDDDEDNALSVGSLFLKRKETPSLSATSPAAIRQAVYATGSSSNSSSPSSLQQHPSAKRKLDSDDEPSSSPPIKRKESTIAHVNREKVGLKRIDAERDDTPKKLPAKPSDVEARASPPATKKAAVANKAKRQDQKKKPLHRTMEKVIFAISGFQNPHRGEIRDRGLEMGAKYKGDWDSNCTHLICAFVNTPKYILVRGQGGRIVTKNWIQDCYKRKELLPWRNYMLGQYSKSTSEEEEDEDMDVGGEDVVEVRKQDEKRAHADPKTTASMFNGTLSFPSTSKAFNDDSPSKEEKRSTPKKKSPKKIRLLENDNGNGDDDGNETESDYRADTDVDSSSAGDTEDEIRKVEQQNLKNAKKKISPKKTNGDVYHHERDDVKSEASPTLLSKPDTKDLPLPVLPNFFKGRKFFLYGEFSEREKHKLQRYITAYNGCIVHYMSESVKYVITLSKWNSDFDEALCDNEDLIFVRPQWIYKCHEKEKFIPFQPHIVIPDA